MTYVCEYSLYSVSFLGLFPIYDQVVRKKGHNRDACPEKKAQISVRKEKHTYFKILLKPLFFWGGGGDMHENIAKQY